MVIQEDNKIILAGDKGYQVLVRVNNAPVLSTQESLSNDNKIRVSPNPINENSSLFFELQQQSDVNVMLFDVKGVFLGQIISDQKLQKGNYVEKQGLQQFNLQGRIYFLKVFVNNRYYKTIKIVK